MTGLYVAFWHTATYDGTTVNVNTTGKITGKLVYEFDEDMTGDAAATENKAVLNITNGNFEITEIKTLFSGVTNEALKKEKITVNGGTFSRDVSAYAADNTPVASNNGTYYVGEETIQNAANNLSAGQQLKIEKGAVTINGAEYRAGGNATYTKPSSGGYYYYHPTTDTKADDTKGSPKTFDAGVGIYAVTAVLSVTGMAWTAKKRGN